MTSLSSGAQQGLGVFSDPASVAVVGASDNPAKWGYWLARGALGGAHRRRVDLINRTEAAILGHPSSASLSELPLVPELVALAVPAVSVAGVVDEGLALGVRGFLSITARIPDEAALARRIRDHGARLIGGNSLGIYDAASDLSLAWGHFFPGPVAIVTQSGQLGSELAIRLRREGIGISRFVSVGNQSDVGATEVLAQLAAHHSTEIVALYLEGFSSGVELFETLKLLRAAGKPTLLLTVGASTASSRLARSHTGSMTADTELIDAVCRASGVLRVRTPAQLVDVVRGFLTVRGTAGRHIAIAGDSGGQCAVAADVATEGGLVIAPLSEQTQSRLAATLPDDAGCENPIDLAGSGEADLQVYASVIEDLLDDPGVETVLLTGYFGRYSEDTPSLAETEVQVAHRIGAAAQDRDKAVVVHTMAPDSLVATALRTAGIPVVGSIERAIRTVRGLATLHLAPPGATQQTPAVQDPSEPGYWPAHALLQAAGVALPAARRITDTGDLDGITTALTAPYVLKAGWIEHKTEERAVVLGLRDEAQLRTAFAEMHSRLGDGEYVVEEQDTRPHCVEMIVGGRRDPALGPVVVVGMGGTEAEVWKDVAIECAPVDAARALAMLERLRCAPLLQAWRGRPAVDTTALADVVAAISQLICTRHDLTEVELNPVRVCAEGALAVDALVVRSIPWSAGDCTGEHAHSYPAPVVDPPELPASPVLPAHHPEDALR